MSKPNTSTSTSSASRTMAATIKVLALDVDGVLTNGAIYYGNSGEELKAFNIKDGLGIKLLQKSGVTVAIITGRQSDIVQRRATELGIDAVIQGREDKLAALEELASNLGINLSECAYMGDDLPDLSAITAAGLGMTVADACATVAAAADWQSNLPGGAGAVREACEFLLDASGSLEHAEEGFR
jgi:3-deoxy-D-manno-octulosonate 8-phosphate phosphatase (KDO 8-P phosphatase)